MSDIEIVIAAMGKIAYNFWPILAVMGHMRYGKTSVITGS